MTYCEAFLLMEVSPLWAILFFMMLVLLGIDSEFGTLEGAVAPLYDLKWVTMRKEIFMGELSFFFLYIPNSIWESSPWLLYNSIVCFRFCKYQVFNPKN